MTYPIHDHVDIYGNLSVNCSYRTAQNTAPGVMNVYIPAGESAGNGVFLQSAGSAGIDQPFLSWRNANQAVQLTIWTDMGGGSSRIKSQGSLSFHTANVALNSGANERMYISPSGNVGIGVNAPEALLHLKAAGSPTVLVESTSANNPALRLRSGGATGTVKAEGAQRMVIGYDAWGNLEFEVGSAGPPKLVIQPSGNVGIGTPSPAAMLDVAGGLRVSGQTTLNGVAYTWPGSGGTANQMLMNNGAGGLYWGGGGGSWTDTGSSLFPSNASANVGIGTTAPDAKLEVARDDGTALLQLAANAGQFPRLNVDILNVGAGSGAPTIRFQPDANGSVAHLALASVPGSGNVGVGTAAPSAKLDVANGNGLGLFRLAVTTGPQFPRLNVNIVDAGTSQPSVQFQADGQTAVPHLVLAPGLGNVGIGMTPTSAKLAVNGEVHTTQPVRLNGAGAAGKLYARGFNLTDVGDVIEASGKVAGNGFKILNGPEVIGTNGNVYGAVYG